MSEASAGGPGGGRRLLQHAGEGLGGDDGGIRGPSERSPALRPLRHLRVVVDALAAVQRASSTPAAPSASRP